MSDPRDGADACAEISDVVERLQVRVDALVEAIERLSVLVGEPGQSSVDGQAVTEVRGELAQEPQPTACQPGRRG